MSEGFRGGREIGDTYLPFYFRPRVVIFFDGSKAHQLKRGRGRRIQHFQNLFVHIFVFLYILSYVFLYSIVCMVDPPNKMSRHFL